MTSEELLTTLAGGSPSERIEALEAVSPESLTSELLNAVATCIEDVNEDVQLAAVEALTRLEDAIEATHLIAALESRNSEVQMRAAEALSGRPEEGVIDALIILAVNASDTLAQISAIESLGDLRAHDAVHPLEDLLRSDDELVRGSAAFSLGEIGDSECIAVVEKTLETEESEHSQVMLEVCLYKLGQHERLHGVISRIQSEDYHVRCAAAHLLADIVDVTNVTVIGNALHEALSREAAAAARSSIRSAIATVDAYRSDPENGKDSGASPPLSAPILE
jgi:HEAT repeat protein